MKARAAMASLLIAATYGAAAHADPDDYVSVPAVEYGERELELRFGTATKSGEDRASAASLAFGYGLTPWWATEVYARYNRSGSEATRFDAIEWENKFQIGEPGQYVVDMGFLVELEWANDRAEGYELRIGPLFQKDFGLVQTNFNFLLERHFRSDEREVTELGYQWQVKYRWRQDLEFGLQGFGDVGKWNDWDPHGAQTHIVGPAIFGKFPLGGRQAFKYNAAVLFKASSAAPDRTLRAQLEYEF
jgi:hypothetical protein